METEKNIDLEIRDGERSSIELMKYIDGLSQLFELAMSIDTLDSEELKRRFLGVYNAPFFAKAWIEREYEYLDRFVDTKADISGGKEIFKDNTAVLKWKNELTMNEKIDFIEERIRKLLDNNSWQTVFFKKSKEALINALDWIVFLKHS